MVTSTSRATLVTAALALLAPLSVAAESRTPPAPHCLDAREVSEVFQSDARTLAMVQSDGQRFRVELGAACPDVTATSNTRMLAANGWMCGTGNEYVSVDSQLCPVAAVAPITSAEYAQHARASQTGADGSTTLATVVVKGERRHGFAASHNYCFNPRHVRGWSEDPRGVVVEVNPRRSGGNRYYRVELVRSCPHLSGPVGISFRSGVGIGLICGNPGDDIRTGTRGTASVGSAGSGPGQPLFLADGRSTEFLMTGSDRMQILGAKSGCPIRAVYPMDAG
ncbi:hypothetical protein [Luteimonas terricola]|uniref:Uncharacterized protein n=1 Tax=Luteimonas terricola TaxID=645597 RepID=A0ABQ2EGJ4_9GAMM|nr:hypothetical protein [Luteimonas terricola]GGK10688.1 hypothetical protein GCM10011394_20190 [Luteimonas terricola]